MKRVLKLAGLVLPLPVLGVVALSAVLFAGNPELSMAILLTHGHTDHISGCHRFPKAEVMALAADVPIAEGKNFATN